MMTKQIFISFGVLFILVVYCDMVENAVIKRMFMSNEMPVNMPIMSNNEGMNDYELQNIGSTLQSLLQNYIQCKMGGGQQPYAYMNYNQFGSSRPPYYEPVTDYPMYPMN
ncbi:hypothetical protein MS3_00008373 [Schistosoma haematobium]|uniref:Uncharacterized protein n=1 Tax=Schistosoma haematobium TaxID=6185 RepID=A0A922IJQ0_SCHHA|nr:hypothetical protein MS3_00008373 [Schistosoma haematobium]KAH9581151.1 hypothetical protein MS3_00008373 [Schistosoma haematobium]